MDNAIKRGAYDLQIHATCNGWHVFSRPRNEFEHGGKIMEEWVFTDLTEMFNFFKIHFLYDPENDDVNPYAVENEVFGGGS